MYWLGKKYAAKETATVPGALIRCLAWSVVACWTVLLIGGGMVPAIVPVPSWGAISHWLVATDASLGFEADYGHGIRVHFIPHVLLSPAVPIVSYWIAFWLNRKQRENSVRQPGS